MSTVLQPLQPNAAPKPPATSDRLAQILPLLACPACRGSLQRDGSAALRCTACAVSYPVRDGVPILLPATMHEPGVGSADADDPVSRHPYSPKALEIIDAHASGWVLDLGAGGKQQRWGNVLQVDIFRYPMTDVVATADCLPFRDNAFSAVISQAVFEHLQYPEAAAGEIRRVLQPHGTLRIDTAFLQPEHGYPHHFYNATETGLRHWFRDFDIDWSGVDSYQHPKWALSWFLGIYLDRLPPEQAELLRQTGTGPLLQALLRSGEGRPEAGDQAILAALDTLPAHELRTLAAGVSIQGRNPAKAFEDAAPPAPLSASPAGPGPGTVAPPLTMQQTRELSAARREIATLREELQTAHENRTIAMDRANYMAQWALFHLDANALPSMQWRERLQFALSALARLVLSPERWLHMRAARHGRRFSLPRGQFKEGAQTPVFTIVLAPDDTNAFIKAFFSLVHQTYPAWELLVLEYPGQPTGVRHMLYDFLRVDERVRALNAPGDSMAERLRHAHQHARGRYLLNLPEGTVLTFLALQKLYTVLRASPEARTLIADLEYTTTEFASPMRCYATRLADAPTSGLEEFGLALHVKNDGRGKQAAQESGPALVHVPEVLFRCSPVVKAPERGGLKCIKR